VEAVLLSDMPHYSFNIATAGLIPGRHRLTIDIRSSDSRDCWRVARTFVVTDDRFLAPGRVSDAANGIPPSLTVLADQTSTPNLTLLSSSGFTDNIVGYYNRALSISVEPVDQTTSTVTLRYRANEGAWTASSLTLSASGEANTVSVWDLPYYAGIYRIEFQVLEGTFVSNSIFLNYTLFDRPEFVFYPWPVWPPFEPWAVPNLTINFSVTYSGPGTLRLFGRFDSPQSTIELGERQPGAIVEVTIAGMDFPPASLTFGPHAFYLVVVPGTFAETTSYFSYDVINRRAPEIRIMAGSDLGRFAAEEATDHTIVLNISDPDSSFVTILYSWDGNSNWIGLPGAYPSFASVPVTLPATLWTSVPSRLSVGYHSFSLTAFDGENTSTPSVWLYYTVVDLAVPFLNLISPRGSDYLPVSAANGLTVEFAINDGNSPTVSIVAVRYDLSEQELTTVAHQVVPVPSFIVTIPLSIVSVITDSSSSVYLAVFDGENTSTWITLYSLRFESASSIGFKLLTLSISWGVEHGEQLHF
jgi:hypothetical protein